MDSWDLWYKNFNIQGVSFNYVVHEILMKYTPSDREVKELKKLTNWELIRLCDYFMPLNYGNIFHGSSERILKNLKDDAMSAYPFIHESIYNLYCDFLDYKMEYGSSKEREMYNGMTICDLVDRLLTKRCASYFGRNENYFLITGEKGKGDFSTIGTDKEVSPLIMENCLTRDEIKLSNFLMISSKVTRTIKDFSYNSVSIGIPFPCLNREDLFDWEDLVISKTQNTRENGYGSDKVQLNRLKKLEDKSGAKYRYRRMWNSLYGDLSMVYDLINRKKKLSNKSEMRCYEKISKTAFLDHSRLAKRFSIITNSLLNEADTRARVEDKWAYIVVDKKKLGLGSLRPLQEEVFLRNFSYEILYSVQYLRNTFAVHFVGFKEVDSIKDGWKMYMECGVFGNLHPKEGIEIMYSKREELNIKEILQNPEILLVETYRLDANALPGNELWMGKVIGDYSHPSFDVRNSAIPFIHNAHVNGTRLCGSNLRVSAYRGVNHWTYNAPQN